MVIPRHQILSNICSSCRQKMYERDVKPDRQAETEPLHWATLPGGYLIATDVVIETNNWRPHLKTNSGKKSKDAWERCQPWQASRNYADAQRMFIINVKSMWNSIITGNLSCNCKTVIYFVVKQLLMGTNEPTIADVVVISITINAITIARIVMIFITTIIIMIIGIVIISISRRSFPYQHLAIWRWGDGGN